MKLQLLITVAAITAALTGCVGSKGMLPVRLTWGSKDDANSEATAEPDTSELGLRGQRQGASDSPNATAEASEADIEAKLREQLLGTSHDEEFRNQVQQHLAPREARGGSPQSAPNVSNNSTNHSTPGLQQTPPPQRETLAPSLPLPPGPTLAQEAGTRLSTPTSQTPSPSREVRDSMQVGYEQVESQTMAPAPLVDEAPSILSGQSQAAAPLEHPETQAPTTTPPLPLAPSPLSIPATTATPSLATPESPNGTAPVAETEDTEASVDWIKQTQDAHDELEKVLARSADDVSPAERNRLEVRLRLMALVLGDHDRANEVIESMAPEQQELWKEEIFALSKLTEPEEYEFDSSFQFNDQQKTALVVEHLRLAERALSAAASLRVHRVALCDRVNSFGNFHEFTRNEFENSQQLIVYCEVDNLKAELQDDPEQGKVFESELKPSIVLFDSDRKTVGQYDFDLIVDRSRHVRRDFYMHFVFTIPADLPPGRYHLGVLLKDLKANKSTNAAPIEIEIR